MTNCRYHHAQAEMVILEHSLYLSEKVSELPTENSTPGLTACHDSLDNSLSGTQQCFLCFVHVLTCCPAA